MKNSPKELIYVIDSSLTISKAIDLYLRRDYDVISFDDYQLFNKHIQNKTEIFPYILLVESSSANKVIRKNNTVVILANRGEAVSDLEAFVVVKPFHKNELIETVAKAEIHLKTNSILLHKETLEKELPINSGEEPKKIKV